MRRIGSGYLSTDAPSWWREWADGFVEKVCRRQRLFHAQRVRAHREMLERAKPHWDVRSPVQGDRGVVRCKRCGEPVLDAHRRGRTKEYCSERCDVMAVDDRRRARNNGKRVFYRDGVRMEHENCQELPPPKRLTPGGQAPLCVNRDCPNRVVQIYGRGGSHEHGDWRARCDECQPTGKRRRPFRTEEERYVD